MSLAFERIDYGRLNSRQKENFNYQKLSGVLADFGFVTHRLSDDWQGADFIAQHISGEQFLKVQLKSRLSFNRKYWGKEIWIAFPDVGDWYLFPTMKSSKTLAPGQTSPTPSHGPSGAATISPPCLPRYAGYSLPTNSQSNDRSPPSLAFDPSIFR